MNTFISDRAPTLRDVARAAGVSLASASYALRGHWTVSARTQAGVRAAAERLGYRVNPQLAAFMQARRTGRSMRADATVALIHGGPRRPTGGRDYFGGCLRGIRAQAAGRGYAVDMIAWSRQRDPAAEKLTRALDQRGIRGVLLMPADEVGRWTLPLDWDRFHGVALDHSLEEKRVHRVSDHHAADMATALREVKAAGWRRPGLVLDRLNNDRTLELRLGAFLARARHDFPDAPPPLVLGEGDGRAEAARRWLRRHAPDGVLAPDARWAGLMAREKTAFVCLANYGAPGEPPGLRIDCEGVGGTAAFLLFSLLESASPGGVGLRPQTILIEGAWSGVAGARRRAESRSTVE